jgi:putative ABC transport system permease protein
MDLGTIVLALSGAAFGAVALLAWRQPLLARLAWREAARRRGQSLLLIVGLMVGAAAIAAALVTADSLDEAATINSHRAMGAMDLAITAGGRPFPAHLATRLAEDPAVAAAVQGILPTVEASGSVANLDRERRRSDVGVVAFEPAMQEPFGVFHLDDGTTTTGDDLRAGEVLMTTDLATLLDAEAGDRLTVWLDGPGVALETTVGGIVAIDGAGAHGLRPTVFTSLETLWQVTGPDLATLLRVTTAGEVFGGIEEAGAAMPALEEAIAGLGTTAELRVVPVKADMVEMVAAESAAPRGMTMGLAGVVVVAGLTLVVSLAHMLAEERRRQLGVLRALGLRRRGLVQLMVIEGAMYSLVAAVVGTGVGVLAGQIVARRIVVAIVGMSGFSDFAFTYTAAPRTVAIALASGASITLVTLVLSVRRTAHLSVVAAVRDLPEPTVVVRGGWRRALTVGLLGMTGVAGVMAWSTPPLRTLGGFLVIAATANLLRRRLPDRLRASLAGAAVVAWSLAMASYAGRVVEADPGPFFGTLALAVPATVFGLALVVVANLRMFEGMVARAGRSRGRLRATLRPPMAELSRRPTRTALTSGAFALALAVIATLTTMNAGFPLLWEAESGATDVVVSTPGSARFDLPAEVAVDVARTVELPTLAYLGARERSGTVPHGAADDAMRPVRIVGVPDHLDDLAPLGLMARDERYGSDAEVWAALHRDPTLAVASAVGLGEQITLIGSGGPVTFTVIAHPESPVGWHALMLTERGLEHFTGLSTGRLELLEVRPGVDVETVASAIERTGFAAGVEAMTFEREAGEIFAAFGSLFSAMTLLVRSALVVGLASLGILAVRAVVERRRQIGVLRALGFRRRQILSGLLAENLALAAFGVVMGLVTGMAMGQLMLRSFVDDGSAPIVFDLPQLAGVVLLVFVATAVVTVAPAVRAARLPPAQAARHLD